MQLRRSWRFAGAGIKRATRVALFSVVNSAKRFLPPIPVRCSERHWVARLSGAAFQMFCVWLGGNWR